MGLEKTITLANGYDATYWTPREITIDIKTKRIVVFLEGYKDKAVHDSAGPDARIDSKFIEIPITADRVPPLKTLRNWVMKQIKAERIEYADAVETEDDPLPVREEPVVEADPIVEEPVTDPAQPVEPESDPKTSHAVEEPPAEPPAP